jgi:very-short-patch-repair endonuclease
MSAAPQAAVPPVPSSFRALDPALVATARSQWGVLTTAQLAAAGHDPRALAHLVRRGILRHPGRGLYVVAELAETDELASHRQLAAGAVLMYPDAVLAGTTALLAHGIPVWGVDLGRPRIRRPITRAGGMSSFWVRPDVGDGQVPTEWGPASPVAPALALHAVDHGIVPGVVSADAALHAGMVTEPALSVAVDAVSRWVHGSRAVAMRSFADGRRESVGESRCGVALAMAGIAVTPQVEIRDAGGRFVARVDFLVDGTHVVIEFDGKVKYADGDPRVLWDEKQREDHLRRLGYTVVRIAWADLERPGAVAARVRAALAAHR